MQLEHLNGKNLPRDLAWWFDREAETFNKTEQDAIAELTVAATRGEIMYRIAWVGENLAKEEQKFQMLRRADAAYGAHLERGEQDFLSFWKKIGEDAAQRLLDYSPGSSSGHFHRALDHASHAGLRSWYEFTQQIAHTVKDPRTWMTDRQRAKFDLENILELDHERSEENTLDHAHFQLQGKLEKKRRQRILDARDRLLKEQTA